MVGKWGDLLYIDTPFRPEAGSFCKPRDMHGDRYKVGQWYYCRELFHSQLYNLNLFFFSHEAMKGNSIASFLQKIEHSLDVHPLTNFGPTQRKTIMWIEPSRWWTVRAMRRSLFTILLRCGNAYNPHRDNFDQALLSDSYIKSTEYATRRFLQGHTIYTGKNRGWYKQFYERNLSKKEIDSLLIKPA